MTSMPKLGFPTNIPVEDYQGQGNQKRGRRGEQVLDQRVHKETIVLSNKRVIADFQLSDKPECLNIALGKTSQPPHHNTHTKHT